MFEPPKTCHSRFQRHPLFAEMDAALERRHEMPFIGPASGQAAAWGFMDCIYRAASGWVLVDFKTDELRSQAALEAAVMMYTPQLLRYRQVAAALLPQPPRSLMCFLNVNRAVEVRELG